MNINYKLWPNTDGNLGNIKVQIPTGIGDDEWPEGDSLVGNFVYKDGKLAGFVDTKALTVNSSGSTTINYDYVNIELPFTEDTMTINRGPRNKYLFIKFNAKEVEDSAPILIRFENMSEETKSMFRSAHKVIDNVLYDVDGNVIGEFDTRTIETASNIIDFETEETANGNPFDTLYYNYNEETEETRGYIIAEFSSNLSGLSDGFYMFFNCTNLTSFSSDLSSLIKGYYMFDSCANLSSFNSDLSSLTDGTYMFYGTNLTSWNIDLPTLTKGESMFDSCINLSSFTPDLSSLTDGCAMFYGCSKLTSFSSDLSNLTNGESMFDSCINLSSWNIDLSKVTDGSSMFYGCSKLTSFSSDLSSLIDGWHMFSECKLDTASVQNIADTINTYNGEIYIGIGNAEPNEQEITAFNTIASKGWTVLVNGSEYTPTSPAAITTLDENGEETVTPIPFWAKPVPSDEQHARYVDEQGNFYNILGGNYIYGDDLSTYGMFTCEEDAATNMRLTKIEKPLISKFVLKH